MDIATFAKESSIPLRILRWLMKHGFIQNPLTEEDVTGLRFLTKLWGNREILRPQMALFSQERRAVFLRTVDVETKWERYAFARFANLQPGENVRMSTLLYEIEESFGFKPNIFQIKRLYRVRRKVYNQRNYSKNKKG